jgi:hypothetical protein
MSTSLLVKPINMVAIYLEAYTHTKHFKDVTLFLYVAIGHFAENFPPVYVTSVDRHVRRPFSV